MKNILVAGIGTDVGKTIVSAILVTLLEGDYWKPIQTGEEHVDSETIAKLITPNRHRIFPSAFSLTAPLSPHHAARLENATLDVDSITPPKTSRTLIIESIGGFSFL